MTSSPMLTLAIWKRSTPRYRVTGAEGHDGDGDERAAERDHGGEDEERALDGEGHQVFFEEELDAVGERLQQAEGADAAGAPAVLHAADDLALQQHRVGDGGERDDEHDGDLEDADEEKDFEVGDDGLMCVFRRQSAAVLVGFGVGDAVLEVAGRSMSAGGVAAERAGGEERVAGGQDQIAAVWSADLDQR